MRAASRMVLPAGTVMSLPFILMLTSAILQAPPYFLEIALNLQVLIHAPHFMHLSVSMQYEGSLCSGAMYVVLKIASAGQFLSHMPQPFHKSRP